MSASQTAFLRRLGSLPQGLSVSWFDDFNPMQCAAADPMVAGVSRTADGLVLRLSTRVLAADPELLLRDARDCLAPLA